MKNLFLSALVIAGLGLVGCKSEQELIVDANTFVAQLGANYQVAKAVSQQYGYAVILNTSTGNYFAININNWSGSNANTYYNQQADAGYIYFNLWSLGGGDYEDPVTGLIFEVQSSDALKDGERALVQDMNTRAVSASLVEMGLSQERSELVATVLVNFKQRQDASAQDLSAALEATMGFTLAQAVAASGNTSAEQALVNAAAVTNSISETRARQLFNMYRSNIQ
jgi:hypothetical protein